MLGKIGKSGMIPRVIEWRILGPNDAQNIHSNKEEET